jgi:tRNA(Arg) A34 adenosine deaminase TadA
MASITIELPDWLDDIAVGVLDSDDQRMAWVVNLAAENVGRGTGGPFSAAIFGPAGLIAAGVNVVVQSRTAIAHAEITAIAAAGAKVGSFDLATVAPTVLYASTEPCAMCLGATVWSGVSRLVCAARDEDARAIGFDEGPKPRDWVSELTDRNISVSTDVLRSESVAVLRRYVAQGGHIYNGGQPD